MITIIHGEDTTQSYKHLSGVMDQNLNLGKEVLIVEAHEIDPTLLRQQLSSNNLFGSEKICVIKNLLGNGKVKQKEILTKIIINSDSDVVIYENKKLSETAIKTFPNTKAVAFNVNPVIFKFLDMLRPNNFRQILSGWNRLIELGHEPEYVFTMVVRQIRLMIQAKSGPSYLKLSAYPKKMIVSQASLFNLTQLLNLHNHLYEIDKKIKTGASTLSLEQLLLQFFLKI